MKKNCLYFSIPGPEHQVVKIVAACWTLYTFCFQGFVVNSRKGDVNTFSFNLEDPDISPHFIRKSFGQPFYFRPVGYITIFIN
jgi:hypothetical protein